MVHDADEVIAELATHLRLALEAGGFGTWRWVKATGEVEWDERMEQLFGLAPGTFDGSFETYQALLHDEDRARVLDVVAQAVEAKGSYRSEHRIMTPAGEVRWLESSGSVTLDTDGEVTGTIGCTHDVTDRVVTRDEREALVRDALVLADREREQRERLELVVAVNDALEPAIPLDELMERVAAAVVPRLGDWCSVHVLETVGSVVPTLALAHVDPKMVEYAKGLQEQFPYDPDAPTGVAQAIRTGEPVLMTNIDDALLRELDVTDEARAVVEELQLRSAMVVPLRKRGVVLGAIQFVMSNSGRHYAPGDLALAEAVAGRVAASLDNRRLRRARDDLAALAASLASARTTEEVSLHVRDEGKRCLDAAMVNVRLIDRDADSLAAVVSAGLPAEVEERYQHLSMSDTTPLTDAVRSNTMVWIADQDDYAARYPDLAEESAAMDFHAVAAVPLRFSDGTVGGGVAFAWGTDIQVTDALQVLVATIADLAGQAVERCRLYEAEHAVIRSLQGRLLAPLPACASVDAAAHYEPASGAIGMGGDWYEAFVLDDGSYVAVIGDVVGHGVEAVAAMAQLQYLVGGLIQSATPLDQVLSRTSEMIAGAEPVYATAQLLHVDAAAGRVGYQSAGHPWALVRHPDGRVEQLSNRHHGLLGTRMSPLGIDYVDAPAGSLILAYTDGLIERRHESITDSMDRLAALLAAVDPAAPLEGVLARIVVDARAFEPAMATTDDIAAILIRVVG
jgi:PAS domain S-box-containing protein